MLVSVHAFFWEMKKVWFVVTLLLALLVRSVVTTGEKYNYNEQPVAHDCMYTFILLDS